MSNKPEKVWKGDFADAEVVYFVKHKQDKYGNDNYKMLLRIKSKADLEKARELYKKIGVKSKSLMKISTSGAVFLDCGLDYEQDPVKNFEEMEFSVSVELMEMEGRNGSFQFLTGSFLKEEKTTSEEKKDIPEEDVPF